MRLVWVVLDYDGNPKPGTWPTEAKAIEDGLCGRYLLTGYDVVAMNPTRLGFKQ